jgi:hypothetical protein
MHKNCETLVLGNFFQTIRDVLILFEHRTWRIGGHGSKITPNYRKLKLWTIYSWCIDCAWLINVPPPPQYPSKQFLAFSSSNDYLIGTLFSAHPDSMPNHCIDHPIYVYIMWAVTTQRRLYWTFLLLGCRNLFGPNQQHVSTWLPKMAQFWIMWAVPPWNNHTGPETYSKLIPRIHGKRSATTTPFFYAQSSYNAESVHRYLTFNCEFTVCVNLGIYGATNQ